MVAGSTLFVFLGYMNLLIFSKEKSIGGNVESGLGLGKNSRSLMGFKRTFDI